MTLSILWRSEGRLHLASDSRISFGSGRSADVGVKIMRLPIRVRDTSLDKGGQLHVLFDKTYGFCYAGSLANAATFQQLVADLLIDVQYLNADVPLSFDELCKFLCRFSSKVSTEIVSSLFEQGTYTFFVAGWCPSTEQLRGAKFSLVQDAGRTRASYLEVVQDTGQYLAVGTGAEEFKTLIAGREVTTDAVLLTLNRIIDEQKVDTVGGDIQYGSFLKGGDFAVYGITRISVESAFESGNQYGPSELHVMRYRGLELYGEWLVPGDNLWPTPGFIELTVPSNVASEQRFIAQCRKTAAGGA